MFVISISLGMLAQNLYNKHSQMGLFGLSELFFFHSAFNRCSMSLILSIHQSMPSDRSGNHSPSKFIPFSFGRALVKT